MSEGDGPGKGVNLEGLRFGDLIEVEWWDASSGTLRVRRGRRREERVGVLVRTVGYFACVKADEKPHLVFMQDIYQIDEGRGVYDFTYTAIPVENLQRVTLRGHRSMAPEAQKVIEMTLTRMTKNVGRIVIKKTARGLSVVEK